MIDHAIKEGNQYSIGHPELKASITLDWLFTSDWFGLDVSLFFRVWNAFSL